MYEILKITKKRNSNFNLYIKNYKHEKIEIHLETLYLYGLLKTKQIEDDVFEKMLAENENKIARQKALKILSMASKTKKEIYQKLKQRGFSEESIKYAMDFIEENNFINEEDIATMLVDGSYSKKKYSKRTITSKLRQKGISSDVINRATQDMDDEEEYQNALYFAKKKMKSIKETDKYKIRNKLGSALSYRGFDYDIINKVTQELLQELDTDEY